MLQAIVVGRGRMCQICGKKRAQVGHHIIRRKYHALRWIARYVIDLCHECHEKDGQPGFKEACIKWLGGQRVYERLSRHAKNAKRPHPEDAIVDMQKVLDRHGQSDVSLGRSS
jgi:hypothetical protein